MLTVDRLLAEDFNPENLSDNTIADSDPESVELQTEKVRKKSTTSSNKTKPWSVKGISDEVRSIAKAEARKADCTMGEWLSRAILSAASLPAAGQSGQSGQLTKAPDKIAPLTGQPSAKEEHLAKVVLQLAERLSSLEKDHVEGQAVTNSKIETLRRYMLSN